MGIPAEFVDKIRGVATPLEVAAGDTFITEGEFDECIYYIESGSVEVTRGDENLGTIDAGDVVGEIAFIDRRPRTATVSAKESTRLLKIDRSDLLRSLGDAPALLMDFVKSVERRMRAHLEEAEENDVENFLTKVTQEAISHRAVHHPYLLGLREGKYPDMKWALKDFARQYHGYSAHFPRYLTTVIGRLENPQHRSALMENLTEESGIYEQDELDELAEIGVKEEWVNGVPHPVLFRRFCDAVGVDSLDPDADGIEVVCWREMFLSVLSGGSPAQAVGALGLGTENVVSTMYQHFLPALEILGVDPSETVFFPLHAAVDDHHQETLLDISRGYANTEEGRLDLVKGMRKALALRAGFWDWMLSRVEARGA